MENGATTKELDQLIEHVHQCKQLVENQVRMLCQKVFTSTDQ